MLLDALDVLLAERRRVNSRVTRTDLLREAVRCLLAAELRRRQGV
jgi:hypothetical protein